MAAFLGFFSICFLIWGGACICQVAAGMIRCLRTMHWLSRIIAALFLYTCGLVSIRVWRASRTPAQSSSR